MPCGILKKLPSGRLVPWTSATEALENAMPACIEPSIIASRAASSRSLQALTMLGPIRAIAFKAIVSVRGLRFLLT